MQFPQEDFVNGFKNQIAAQDISPLLAEAYNTAAERLAKNAFLGGDDTNRLIPCKPARRRRARDEFIRTFGLRAFRRPLTEPKSQRYTARASQRSARSGDFLRALNW